MKKGSNQGTPPKMRKKRKKDKDITVKHWDFTKHLVSSRGAEGAGRMGKGRKRGDGTTECWG